jgi:hypothetical protein
MVVFFSAGNCCIILAISLLLFHILSQPDSLESMKFALYLFFCIVFQFLFFGTDCISKCTALSQSELRNFPCILLVILMNDTACRVKNSYRKLIVSYYVHDSNIAYD